MPLRVPAPPAQAADAVHTTFQALADGGALRLPALRDASGPLELTQPHQVFTLGLDDLAAGRGLAAARPTGWRYLVRDSGGALAAADTVTAGPADGYVFSAVNQGRFVASTAAAIDTAQALTQVTAGDFELRLLHIPALHVMAVWLHDMAAGAAGDASDLLVPLDPSPVAAPAGQPAAAAALLAELAAQATSASAGGPSDSSGG